MKKFLLLILLLCLFTTPCYANAGIPVFMFLPTIVQATAYGFGFLHLGEYFFWGYVDNDILLFGYLGILYGFVLLWLVVLIEYNYLRPKLPKIESKILEKEIWIGNTITTLIGVIFWIPAFWAKGDRLAFMVFGPLGLTNHSDINPSIIYIALPFYLFFIIYICFVLSHRIEASFIKKIKGEYTDKEISIAVKRANRQSYWTLFLSTFFPPVILFFLPFYIIENRKLKKSEINTV